MAEEGNQCRGRRLSVTILVFALRIHSTRADAHLLCFRGESPNEGPGEGLIRIVAGSH